jgi:hypothetical protein
VTEGETEGIALHAWVDESMQVARDGHGGWYVLAAVVTEPGACSLIREELRKLLLKGTDRLHWREESTPRHEKIASAIAGQDVAHVVVVGAPLDRRKQERARGICMERLLFELEQLGVTLVWLDGRKPQLNARDLRLVEGLRGKRAISGVIHVDFAYSRNEEMLWIPDAVAGAVSMARQGRESHVRLAFGELIDEIDVDLV